MQASCGAWMVKTERDNRTEESRTDVPLSFLRLFPWEATGGCPSGVFCRAGSDDPAAGQFIGLERGQGAAGSQPAIAFYPKLGELGRMGGIGGEVAGLPGVGFRVKELLGWSSRL